MTPPTQLSEQCIDLFVDAGTFHIPGLHHQVQARLAATLDGSRLKFAQIVTGLVAEQADEKGAVAREAARVEIRP